MRIKFDPRIMLVVAVLGMLSMACSLPLISSGPGPGPAITPENEQTQTVRTIEAMMTQVVAGNNTVATQSAPTSVPPTAVAQEPTLRPSSTPFPTATTVVLPNPSPTSVCDQGGFISDVTIPDGSFITGGSQFDKTWRIRNNGTCTWTADYAIVFDRGDAMGAPASQTLGKSVLPGETVDITIKFTAPGASSETKTYRSEWRLRNAAGVLFGLGAGSKTFYVEIKVSTSVPVNNNSGYDFAGNYCQATWTGNDKTLSCPGVDGDTNGFLLYKAKPALETGYVDDEAGLITNPPKVNDGVIRGKYPAFTVKTGDVFQSIIGCEYNAKNCNVRFQLDYQIDNGTIQTFKSWNEAYDSSFTTINEDLSSLNGKAVTFILTVYANGASDGDRAQWLYPRITR